MAGQPATSPAPHPPKRKSLCIYDYRLSRGAVVGVAAVGMFTALGLASDLSHFTWWYLTVYTCHLVNLVAYSYTGNRALAERFLWLIFGMTVVVIAGILVMSFSGCSVVRDTSADIGPVAYAVANFAAHYLPSVITIAATAWLASPEDRRAIFPATFTDDWLARVHRELWGGLILFVAYGALVDVNSAYGCHISNTTIITLVSLIVLCCHLLIDRLTCNGGHRQRLEPDTSTLALLPPPQST